MKTLDITGLTGLDLSGFIGTAMNWYPEMKVPSETDGLWERNNPQIVFAVRDIPGDVYRKLCNYTFMIDGVNFTLASVAASTLTESDRGYDGWISSTHGIILITFKPKAS